MTARDRGNPILQPPSTKSARTVPSLPPVRCLLPPAGIMHEAAIVHAFRVRTRTVDNVITTASNQEKLTGSDGGPMRSCKVSSRSSQALKRGHSARILSNPVSPAIRDP